MNDHWWLSNQQIIYKVTCIMEFLLRVMYVLILIVSILSCGSS